MQSPIMVDSLDRFLERPNIEGSPAWEFIDGQPQQKSMPTLFCSRLQRSLVNTINSRTSKYEAIQELRCVVPPFSPVPDIVVVDIDRLPTADGPFVGVPDWIVEIRSPDQSTLELQKKILHFMSSGAELAWLIDIGKEQIWVWQTQDLPLIYAEDEQLPVLAGLSPLTVAAVIAMTQS